MRAEPAEVTALVLGTRILGELLGQCIEFLTLGQFRDDVLRGCFRLDQNVLGLVLSGLHRADAIVIFLFQIFIGHLNGFDELLGRRLGHHHALGIFNFRCELGVLECAGGPDFLTQQFALDQFLDDLVFRHLVLATALVNLIGQNFKRRLADRLAIHRRDNFAHRNNCRSGGAGRGFVAGLVAASGQESNSNGRCQGVLLHSIVPLGLG